MARNTYIKTASGWEQIASTVMALPQGLVPIVPESVAGTGVSYSGDGLVSFSASTAISLNGVFSNAYDQYFVMFDCSTVAAATSIGFRMRVAGVDASASGSYLMALTGTSTGGANTAIATSGTQATFTYAPAGYAYANASLTFIDPFIATPTKIHAITSGTDSGYTTLSSRSGIMAHSTATSYDGVTFVTTSGITGTVRVYGYSKGGLTQPAQIQPYSMAAGQVTISPSAASFATATVTFPVGRFSQAPRIAAFKTSIPSNSADWVVQSVAPTSTGVTIYAYAAGGVARTFSFTADWQATQMLSSAASG